MLVSLVASSVPFVHVDAFVYVDNVIYMHTTRRANSHERCQCLTYINAEVELNVALAIESFSPVVFSFLLKCFKGFHEKGLCCEREKI